MLHQFFKFAETNHEARLEFSESVEVIRSRARELSGSRLAVGRGMISRSQVTLDGDEMRVSVFGRTLLRGRVESQPQGSSLVLTASAPLLQVGVYFWWLTMAYGAIELLKGFVLSDRMEFEYLVECFLFASFVGSLLFPSLWGRGK